MQKHILVPVDFSVNALNVAIFAQTLATHFNYEVRLLHVYKHFQSGFQSAAENRSSETDAICEATGLMEQFLKQLEERTGARPQYEMHSGGLTESIANYCEENDPILIVMGTKGATGMKYVMLGSQTFEVTRMTPKPLLIVPENILDFKLKNAGLLSDLRLEDQYSLNAFLSIFGREIQMKLIHLSRHESNISEELRQKVEEHTHALGFSAGVPNKLVGLAVGGGVGLARVIVSEQLDMLVITIREKSLFERLLNRSFSKSVIHHPDVPVLIVRTPTA